MVVVNNDPNPHKSKTKLESQRHEYVAQAQTSTLPYVLQRCVCMCTSFLQKSISEKLAICKTGVRIGPPPPSNGAGGQHPGRMAVRVWEEVKIMKAEEHVVGVSRRNW